MIEYQRPYPVRMAYDTRKWYLIWRSPFRESGFVNGIQLESLSHNLDECMDNYKKLVEDAKSYD